MSVTMSDSDFTTLANWAEMYGLSTSQYNTIRLLTEKIEKANGLTRYFLMVRWRDRSEWPTSATESDWPPQKTLELVRHSNPWRYEDVMDAVRAITAQPFQVEVTTDRTGTVGWMDIDSFYWRS